LAKSTPTKAVESKGTKKSASVSGVVTPTVEEKAKRVYVSQANIPRRSLREALTVAQAITDNFAGSPTQPHQIAIALNISPTSSSWRDLTGATVAYGLTKGAYNSDKIGLESLGKRATAPTVEGDDVTARAEAALKPKVFSSFFEKYDRNKLPPDLIARNVLQQDFNVPSERLDDVLSILKENGTYVGFIQETKTGPFVSITNPRPSPVTGNSTLDRTDNQEENSLTPPLPNTADSEVPHTPVKPVQGAFRVFITHGKDMAIVDQVKDVLDLYDIEYEVAVEEETTAIPVPQKVLAAMRRCQAGVMVVSADEQPGGSEGSKINNNVLIEIGAAFVLYDQRVVLLWDKSLKVPSNLQGLYRCEFEGNQLTFAVGTRLAKAVKGFK
jgi:predicted nucleotide-binding protein